ncbi:hypothetical protein D4764_10G0010650, partial [Takifugu flavidus]
PRADLIRSQSSTAGQLFHYLGNFHSGNWMVHLLVIRLCSTLRIRVGDISSSPRKPNTVWVSCRLPPLRRRTVCQNLLGADQKSSSIASPNSSHARVFASATVVAATRLANLYCLRRPTDQP